MLRWFFSGILCLTLLFSGENDFDAAYTEVITLDESSENVLFRGDIPLRNDSFQRGRVRSAMKKAFKAYGKNNNVKMSWPRSYNMLFISNVTLDNAVENEFISVAYDYFTGESTLPDMKVPFTHRNRGTWYWWQVNPYYDFDPPVGKDVTWAELDSLLGSLTRSEVQNFLINQTWDGRTLDFVSLIELLNTTLTTKSSKPTMIYIHSRRGLNRSAAISTAYRMRYMGQDIETAYNNSMMYQNGSLVQVYEPQGLKGFLYYYKRYLELWSP
ncbi:MAG: dual specificity protein phosphatase family protein [Simkaniaceae bacterium]|nr:dual specificity protein phosphatase family protein [Simkaniaceae bacterium]